MNWLCRTALPAVAVLCCLPLVHAGGASSDVEYAGGTVGSLQPKTVGFLDTSDAKSLRFRYPRGSFQVEYSGIRDLQFSTAKRPARNIAHLPLPVLPVRGRSQVMDVSFLGGDGKLTTASFLLSGSERSRLEDVLPARVEAGKQELAAPAGPPRPGAWWGDKYWKTTRNQAAWPPANVVTQ